MGRPSGTMAGNSSNIARISAFGAIHRVRYVLRNPTLPHGSDRLEVVQSHPRSRSEADYCKFRVVLKLNQPPLNHRYTVNEPRSSSGNVTKNVNVLRDYRAGRAAHNGLVAGSSPAGPTSRSITFVMFSFRRLLGTAPEARRFVALSSRPHGSLRRRSNCSNRRRSALPAGEALASCKSFPESFDGFDR